MLRSLQIKGFKLFGDIDLPRLGQLNLFFGENNTGKTCLLEAIEIFDGSDLEEDVAHILLRRGDLLYRQPDRIARDDRNSIFGNPLASLFSGSSSTSMGVGSEMLFEDRISKTALKLRIGLFRREEAENELVRLIGVSPEDDTRSARPYLEIEEMPVATKPRVVPLSSFSSTGASLRMRRIAERDPHMFDSTAHVPAAGLDQATVANYWDSSLLRGQAEMVLEWLKILDRDISGISIVGGDGSPISERRVPFVNLKGQKDPQPLRRLGDGLTRLFHIGLAAAKISHGGRLFSQGVLLIDEFENGLHWRVQSRLWKALFAAAQKFDLQVFATTHSRDTIRGFLEASRESDAETSLYRLDREKEHIFPTYLTSDSVEDALETGVEVR